MRKVLHAFAALADLGEEIAETSDFEEMVRSALHVVLGALGVRRGAVAEVDRESSSLRFVAARGFGESLPPDVSLPLKLTGGNGAKTNGNGAHAHAPAKHEPALSKQELARVEREIREQFEGRAVEVVTPLLVRGELVGVILLGGKASGQEFAAEDRELVRSLGRHIGVGLHNHRLLREVERRAEENRRLYDGLKAIYKDTVRAFAAAIDCKDKYTQGHSERVGKYSEIIAREMGWEEEEVEGIAIAGYLHDIGKLVVDRDIINAPYRIDAKNSSELNRHPAAGYEILRPINHPFADIPLMARYHHERPDGRGYPEGLKDEEIPLGAKIVSLADSFDAMTTDRPYRRRRAFEEVVEDFRRNAGRQFSPAVVAAFCRALLKEARGETRPRTIIRLLGKDYVEEQALPALEQLINDLESGTHVAAGRA
ncbi:MAG TPA: HD domain-containing phosphohydrolase [Pyrinomonadaceae bacterium]|jgi:HD-GYP domain-containing protein (c-di-GMP phosphodiesterase class II)|nr:HD domain-containing phosphohydrolase [Pyrinomonadaceae bacterium]